MKQLRTISRVLPIIALPLAMLVTGACGDDDSTGNQLSNADVAGDWTLMSFQIVPQPAFTPPTATGTLHLTDTRYAIVIVRNVTGAPDTVVSDRGSYTLSGSSWSQTSDDPQVPPLNGSASLVEQNGNEVLQVNASAGGVDTHSFWTRPE
ncbi:MAG TPA: hypothetical protein VFK04_12575 [Gemmatimonadaceae bacterium]|jgi:hypothetical protein|nr:hypothetical protein [Gemmatimonadaceae bacterium]